jgi:hypothetical protein
VGFTYPAHQLQGEQDYVTSGLKTRAAGYPIPICITGNFVATVAINNWPNVALYRQAQPTPHAKQEKSTFLYQQD